MRDTDGKIIYVGKATNLRSRLMSYCQTFLTTKTQVMMQEVVDISYRKTESDLDAFLLEACLIKELQPKYNLRLTDDKTFPLLAITKEEFPRVFITRERGKKDNIYYGPFISNNDLRNALRTLQRIFRFRTCRYKIYTDKKQPVPKSCLLSHINLCSAPCLDKISQSDYRQIMTSLKSFLNGNKSSLKKRLKELMKEASQRLDYENAAAYRDQLNSLKNIATIGKLGPFYEEPLLSETPYGKT
jgi:excinuclease ABC subunit C